LSWRITPADFPSIRAAIDVSLTAGSLSDEIIALPIYSGQAEQAVLARVPDADTASAARQAHLHNAALLYAAASLVFAIPSFIREQGPEFAIQVQRIDPAVLAADLRNRADAELLAGAVAGTVSLVQTMFTVVPGTRGRY
jgi:hypothetical protein